MALGFLERGGEFEVEPVELLACFFAESVETRGWKLLRPVWLCPWILPPDRIRSERLFRWASSVSSIFWTMHSM